MNETRKANNRDISPASDVQLILGRNRATLWTFEQTRPKFVASNPKFVPARGAAPAKIQRKWWRRTPSFLAFLRHNAHNIGPMWYIIIALFICFCKWPKVQQSTYDTKIFRFSRKRRCVSKLSWSTSLQTRKSVRSSFSTWNVQRLCSGLLRAVQESPTILNASCLAARTATRFAVVRHWYFTPFSYKKAVTVLQALLKSIAGNGITRSGVASTWRNVFCGNAASMPTALHSGRGLKRTAL